MPEPYVLPAATFGLSASIFDVFHVAADLVLRDVCHRQVPDDRQHVVLYRRVTTQTAVEETADTLPCHSCRIVG
jgi:hypothetical protein